VLSRWPIRLKLLGALAILTTIVGVLALAGFWGLYGYRFIATSVSQRAEELPLSNRLTRAAGTLSEACYRIRSGLDTAYPIDGKLQSIAFREENDRFHDALQVYQETLQEYHRRLQHNVAEQNPYFSDLRDQQAILDQLSSRIQQIEAAENDQLWTMGLSELDALQTELTLLVQQTERLPQLLHGGMAGLRSEVRGRYRTMITLAWSSLIAAIVMLGVLLGFFRHCVVRPFRGLLAGSRIVARGNLDHRIDLGTGDEFAELATAMNGMTDRFQRTYTELENVCRDLDKQVRDRTREVVQREQLASVGFLAAGVAHEINNPLASIAWSAEALESRLHPLLHGDNSTTDAGAAALSSDQMESLKTNLRRIQEEAFRCKGITERLLDFSRMGDVTKAAVDLTELVSDVVAMVGTLGQYRCKTVHLDAPGPVVADVNGQQIKQVVLNLLTNALESLDLEGEVTVCVRRTENEASIVVSDNGCGMTSDVLEHLFEPFFTRRRDGRGTGLGLSITYRIVNQHGGELTAHSDGPGKGSRLQVTLPLRATSDVPHERLTAA